MARLPFQNWKSPLGLDRFFLALSPLWVFFFVLMFAEAMDKKSTFEVFGVMFVDGLPRILFSGLTQGHILLVLYRAFLNPIVYQRYKWRSVIGTLGTFGLALASQQFFLILFLANIFWLQYHYMMQHFGVGRMLTAPDRLANKTYRRFDLLFVALAFFSPIFWAAPDLIFNPEGIQKSMVSLNLHGFISFLMLLLETVTDGMNKYSLIIKMFFGAYLTYVWSLVLRKRERPSKLLFYCGFLLTNWVAFVVLQPAIGMFVAILLHSLQYYYLVSKTEKSAFPRMGVVFTQIVIVLSGLVAGVAFFLTSTDRTIELSTHLFPRVVLGIPLALNSLHFWMDGYVWKRPTSSLPPNQILKT
jgi:hypothetical protein